MTDIVLPTVTTGYNISTINSNFDKVKDALNNDTLRLSDGNNVMRQPLDMNSNKLLNVAVDRNDPRSLLTVAQLNAEASLRLAADTTEASTRAAADAALQTAIVNLSTAQNSGFIGYLTLASLNADLSKPEGTIAYVTNDPTPSNNTTYRKSGAAGTGSWVATFDRVTLVSNSLASLTSTLTSTAGASSVGFIQAGTNAASRTVQDKLRERISVKDFGALGDGITNDAVAFQRAFDYIASLGNGQIFIDRGTYLLSSSITLSNAGIKITGAGSDDTICVFSGSQSGFVLADSGTSQIANRAWEVSGLTIAKNGQGGDGLSCSRNNLSANPTIPSMRVSDVVFRGYTDIASQYWDRGLYELNNSAILIEKVSFIGNGDGPTTGIYIDNANNASRYNLSMNKINIQGGQIGIQVRGHCENVRITDYEIVGQQTNILFDATGSQIPGGQNPVCLVSNGHSNAKNYGIHCINWQVLCVTGSDVFSGVGTNDGPGANINVTNGSYVNVTGCKVGTGAVGQTRVGVELINVTDASITGNNMQYMTGGFVVTSGSSADRISIGSNVFAGYPPLPSSSGVYIGSSSCRTTIVGNVFSYCTNGVNGFGYYSHVSDNSFANCPTDINFTGTSYTIGKNSSTNSPINMTLSGIDYHKELFVTTVVDPPSIPANSRTTLLVSISQAVLGDIVTFSVPYDLSNLQITSAVQANGVVALYFKNDTGSAIDLGSQTWKFKLER